MIDIEVMYADLSRQRVPVADAVILPKTGVLFIILSASGAPVPRRMIDGIGYDRVAQSSEFDHYFLLREPGRFMLRGWDDREFFWKYEADPFVDVTIDPGRHIAPKPPGLPVDAVIFEGEQIAKEIWEGQAIPLFDAEMY